MRRLLLVSYCFPPQRNPESLLVLATTKALVAAGWHVTVVTVDPSQTPEAVDQDLIGEIPESVFIVRTGNLERYLSAVPRIRRICWYGLEFLGLPEQQCGWFFAARDAVQDQLASGQFDIVHSWASYQTSNIVALVTRKCHKLPWVAHFSDPWTDSPYYRPASFLQKIESRKIERSIIEKADAVVFTTPETVNLVMKKYSLEFRKKACVVPHGYDPSLLLPDQNRISAEPVIKKRLTITHTGAFYPGLREPKPLLYALAMLNQTKGLAERIHFRLVGPNATRYQSLVMSLGLEGIVELLPPVGRRDAILEAARADILLVIDAPADESVFLPSKLIDYLMFKKHIYGISPSRGATARVLNEAGFTSNDPADIEGIAIALERFMHLDQASLAQMPVQFAGCLRRYHIAETTGHLCNILDRAIDASTEMGEATSV